MSTKYIFLVICLLIPFSQQNTIRRSADDGAKEGVVEIQNVSSDPDRIKFYLYPNSANARDYDEIIYGNANSIRNSRYNPSKRLIIYSSGFMQNFTTDQAVKDAYLRAGFASTANIIVVDWGELSGNKAKIPAFGAELFILNLYSTVKDRIDIVGNRLKEFIVFLSSNGFLPNGPSSIHLVGQSMGAHVSGSAGMLFKRATGSLIGRITGTDAAGPLFQGSAVDKRLDSSDAAFVDSYHTNDGGYGYSGAFADADFFINGGKAPQPGCDGTETFCSHNMAVAYMAKSIIDTSVLAVSKSDSTSIPWGEYCPSSARGSYDVDTTPDY